MRARLACRGGRFHFINNKLSLNNLKIKHANRFWILQQSQNRDNDLYDVTRTTTIPWAQFIAEIENIQRRVLELSRYVLLIGPLHQRALSSPSSVIVELDTTVSRIWSLNWRIRDAIHDVELDAFRSSDTHVFDSVRNKKLALVIEAKNKFEAELRTYQDEEIEYQEKYREHIARQYHLIYPEAREAELRQAAGADWSNDRVFKSAVSLILEVIPSVVCSGN
jgi:t-SNARE complex subunit (syntaxin)